MTPRDLIAAAKGPTGKAVGALALGVAAFAASASLVVQGDIAASVDRARTALERDADLAKQDLKALHQSAEAARDRPPLTSVPAFIDRVGALAKAHNASVEGVMPLKGETSRFEIDVRSGYRALIGFVAALEELDVAVTAFDARRAAVTAGAPELEARIVIRPRNDARQLHIPRLEAVRAVLAAKSARNPFQPAVAADAAEGAERQDLTAAYRLTGVATLQPSGERIATIDLFDYVVGDMLDGRRVVHVGEDRVYLNAERDGRDERFVIRMTAPRAERNAEGG